MPPRQPKVPPKSNSSQKESQDDIYSASYISASLNKAELEKRLRVLTQNLAEVDQDVDHTHLDACAASLVVPSMLQHSDKTIRLLLACCLSDIIRVYAPDAPYTDDQIKEIFSLFVSQLKGLDNPKGPNYQKYFYLLERLAVVKATVLLVEMHADDLIFALFRSILEVVSPEHSSKVEQHMLDIMSAVLEEWEVWPQELTDIILSKIISPAKDENPSAAKLARNLILRCSNRIQPHVTQFLNAVMVESKTLNSDLADRVHDIIYELNSIDPSILVYVLPNLENEFKVEDFETRLRAVTLAGRIFSEKGSTVASAHSKLFSEWLRRFSDIKAEIRTLIVELAKPVLQNMSPSDPLAKQITDILESRILDPDDKVRKAVVSTTCDLLMQQPSLIPQKLVDAIAERSRDKKIMIRKETMQRLAEIYIRFADSKDTGGHTPSVSFFPGRLFVNYMTQEDEVKVLLDSILEDMILPADLKSRTDRLVEMYSTLDTKAQEMFVMFLKEKRSLQEQWEKYLQVRKEIKEDDATDKRLVTFIGAIVQKFPEPLRSVDLLKRLHSLKDNRIFQHISNCIDPQKEYREVKESQTEALKRIGSKHAAHDYMKQILVRMSNTVLGRQHVAHIFSSLKAKLGHDDQRRTVVAILNLLTATASVFPTFFTGSFHDLAALLEEDEEDHLMLEHVLKIWTLTGHLAEKHAPAVAKCIKPRLLHFCEDGTPKEAKLAVIAIAKVFGASASDVLDGTFRSIVDGLTAGPKLLSRLKTVAYVASLLPSLFDAHKQRITSFVVNITTQRAKATPGKKTKKKEKASDDGLENFSATEDCQIKMAAVKVMVHYLLPLTAEASAVLPPVFKLLSQFLDSEPSSSSDGERSSEAVDCANLRLTAACGFLRLARVDAFDAHILPELYDKLSMRMQDQFWQVRETFAKKLYGGIMMHKLSFRYAAFLPLAAIDPEKELVQKARQYLATIIRRFRHISEALAKSGNQTSGATLAMLPEQLLVYLLHILAHHPLYEEDAKARFRNTSRTIAFFVEELLRASDNLPNPVNLGLVLQLLQTIKQTEDAVDPDLEIIFVLSELAQQIVLSMSTGKQVRNENYPANIVLPAAYYRKPRQVSAVNSRVAKVFLPADFALPEGLKRVSVGSPSTATPLRKSAPKIKGTPASAATPSEDEEEESAVKPSASRGRKSASETPGGSAKRLPRRKSKKAEEDAEGEAEADKGSDSEAEVMPSSTKRGLAARKRVAEVEEQKRKKAEEPAAKRARKGKQKEAEAPPGQEKASEDLQKSLRKTPGSSTASKPVGVEEAEAEEDEDIVSPVKGKAQGKRSRGKGATGQEETEQKGKQEESVASSTKDKQEKRPVRGRQTAKKDEDEDTEQAPIVSPMRAQKEKKPVSVKPSKDSKEQGDEKEQPITSGQEDKRPAKGRAAKAQEKEDEGAKKQEGLASPPRAKRGRAAKEQEKPVEEAAKEKEPLGSTVRGKLEKKAAPAKGSTVAEKEKDVAAVTEEPPRRPSRASAAAASKKFKPAESDSQETDEPLSQPSLPSSTPTRPPTSAAAAKKAPVKERDSTPAPSSKPKARAPVGSKGKEPAPVSHTPSAKIVEELSDIFESEDDADLEDEEEKPEPKAVTKPAKEAADKKKPAVAASTEQGKQAAGKTKVTVKPVQPVADSATAGPARRGQKRKPAVAEESQESASDFAPSQSIQSTQDSTASTPAKRSLRKR